MNSEAPEMTPAAATARPNLRQEPVPEYTPDTDIYELEAHYLLVVDMPGVDLRDNVLEITGTPQVEDPVHHQLLYRGYRQGSFRRTFELGGRIDQAGIQASMRHGTLRVVLPKARETQPRKIAVTVD